VKCILGAATALLLLIAPAAQAQISDPAYTQVGTVKPRSSSELAAAGLTSPFGIGGETTDRGFSTYSNWASYLGPTGATTVRIQSGWHQVEETITTPATYNFTVLDQIVDGVRAQGVQPFMFLGYGNERAGCTNCGTKGLGGSLPSAEGKTRFINFVKATVNRYKTRVTDWEIWNEPDGHVDATEYAQLAVDVAKAIKAIQPGAKITIGSFTGGIFSSANRPYAQTVVDHFAANKGSTVPDADVYVAYHPYWANPDYDGAQWQVDFFTAFRNIVTAKNFKLRQGENGAPSTPCQYFALCGSQWNEDSQAMYLLRRMAGDFWRDIPTNIFTLSDLHYDSTKNTKGLLETGTWNASVDTPYLNGDQTVKRRKKGYYAFQNMTSIFDNRLQKVTNHGCTAPTGYTVHAYSRNDAGIVRNMLVVWKRTATLPLATTPAPAPISITCTNFHFPRMAGTGLQPRYADLLSGTVYATNGVVTSNNAGANDTTLGNLRVGDWPAVIADQGIVLFQ
jgi:hypothetical protein